MKGKENACADFLSQNEACSKLKSMSNEEATNEIFRPAFREQKKTIVAITRSMRQKEEKSKLLSQDKLPTFEEDFQQPKNG
uniref:Uncharacterized protein n=1 Tax=Romanomermis culicivorax TaxID=13658 RepID=A0A915KC93_ROMCU